MSDTPTSLFSRVMTYPIYILPGHRFPRIDVRDAIAKSDLPAPAQQLITDVVRRTRLWKGEKGEVALELIAHFRDGLEAGPSADELISSFGSIKTAAQLIRRGKRRNRPLWWHAQRRFLQAIGAVLLVYIGLALLLVVRHPNPTVDYLAELNGPVLATPLADRAWPIYRAAWTAARIIWDPKPHYALYFEDQKGEQRRFLRPGDARWPETVALLRQHKAFLDAAREAGLKPSLGWELHIGDSWMSPEDRAAFGYSAPSAPRAAPASRVDQLAAGSTFNVMLPFLSPMRKTAEVLAADIRLAASEDDGDRLLADYRAMLGMARQCKQTPILANELVGLGILELADCAVMEVTYASPALVGQRRVELLHVMASAQTMFKMDISFEQMGIMDCIQRVYSDNGKGDGQITLDGLQFMTMLQQSSSVKDEPTRYGWVQSLIVLPAAVTVAASRKELTEQADRFFALAREDDARPLWVKLRAPGRATALNRQWKASDVSSIHYGLLSMLTGSFERAGIAFDQARAVHEAAMAAMALGVYRDRTGNYPLTLTELVPHYLPTMPLDYSTGGPLQYKLVAGKPLLYGLGKDGVDDGGIWPDKKAYWPSVPDTGDWVLYPPIETE